MSFRTKKSLDMYCKSSYILLVVAACAVASGGEESSATVGKTKVISTTGTGGTSSLQRLGSGGLGSSSVVAACAVASGGEESSATVGKTKVISTTGTGGTSSLQRLGSGGLGSSSQLQRNSSLRSGSLSSGGSGNATLGSTGRLSISSVGSGVSQQGGLVGIDPSSGLPTGKVQHKYGVSASNFLVKEVPGGIEPGERYVQFTNTKGKLVTYKEGLFTKLKLLWNESEIGRDRYIGSDGKVHSYIYRSKPKWISGLDILKEGLFTKLKLLWNESEIGRDRYIGSDGKVHSYIYRSKPKWISGLDILNAQGGDGGLSSLPQQQRNISSSVTGSANRSVGTQTETGNLGGFGTPKKDTGTSPTIKKYTSQLNLDVDRDGNITKQNKGTNTEGVGETTSVVTPLGGDKEFSNPSTQTVISGSGLQPKKRTNKGVGTQTDPSITGERLTSLVAKSDGSQTSSGDGVNIPVNSVVYKFGKMPRFVPKGSESDTVKPSTSVGIDVASGGEKTTKPFTDTGSGGDGKTYTSTLRINLGGKGQQSSSTQTGSGGSSPSGSRGASLEQQSSSSQTGSGAATQGGSGSSPSGNKGASSSGQRASSSGQQGQGSSSQQSASGSGAQGVSGDGSGGKKTPSSPVSGQTTSSSGQIEVKDEQGNTHQAVLVNTKGTSGGGASKKPNLSTIVEEGESSQVIGQQGKGSLVQNTHQAVLVNTKGTSGGGASKKPNLSTIVEEGESSQVIGQQGKGSLVHTHTGDEKKYSATFVILDEEGNIVQTSGQRGQQSSSTQTGGAGEQGEASKGSKPLTGDVKGTVVTSTEVSSGIDFNEAKKQLIPVS